MVAWIARHRVVPRIAATNCSVALQVVVVAREQWLLLLLLRGGSCGGPTEHQSLTSFSVHLPVCGSASTCKPGGFDPSPDCASLMVVESHDHKQTMVASASTSLMLTKRKRALARARLSSSRRLLLFTPLAFIFAFSFIQITLHLHLPDRSGVISGTYSNVLHNNTDQTQQAAKAAGQQKPRITRRSFPREAAASEYEPLAAAKIPHRLYFIHTQRNILKSQEPKKFYENLINTITLYKRAWAFSRNISEDLLKIDFVDDYDQIISRSTHDVASGHSTILVHFLTDTECRKMIQATEPRLIPYYVNETRGAFQADMCRISALYLTGGYYFDVDMKSIKAWIQDDDTGDHANCSFSTVHHAYQSYMSQSFIAALPGHAVLRQALTAMLEHYQILFQPLNTSTVAGTIVTGAERWQTNQDHSLMGPRTLHAAYDALQYSKVESSSHCLLEELDIQRYEGGILYPNLKLQYGRGGDCNHIMHSVWEKEVYFFSRFVGASDYCLSPLTPQVDSTVKVTIRKRKK